MAISEWLEIWKITVASHLRIHFPTIPCSQICNKKFYLSENFNWDSTRTYYITNWVQNSVLKVNEFKINKNLDLPSDDEKMRNLLLLNLFFTKADAFARIRKDTTCSGFSFIFFLYKTNKKQNRNWKFELLWSSQW